MKSLIEIPKKMKALNLHGVGDLRYEDVDVPALEPGTVLLKIKACGICSSDIPRIFTTGTYHFPTIPGHEFSGQIVAVGDGVDESLLGRRSCVFPMLPCRKCHACELEEWAQCSGYSYFGSRQDGGFAEYLAVPAWNLVPFSDSLSYEEAALCEPAAVSLHAVNISGIKKGDNAVIVGTGAIALLIGLFAKKRSETGTVIIAGRSADKLENAAKMGFETVNTSEEDISAGVKRITGREGTGVVIEAVGTNEAISNAVKAAAALGKVVLVGNPYGDLNMEKNVYWSILRKQLTLAGSWNSSYNSRVNDWKEAISIFESGELALKGLISRTYKMSECEQAFAAVRDKDTFTLRVMFTMD
ncbi:MAG: galactitol-1-phosphate 5-dehydrogenase [Ruminococcus sp.]|nr:galactitol-1-phosphate 5-dehydrogenase [Ruminococcus sp.]